ncbi:MAG TPA: glycosyltransferase family 39 protein [Candidatus Acidoferrales bacterium]|nr:glycosyltransferase family 39 protein [Candidatus Acidoferrales bacterium]
MPKKKPKPMPDASGRMPVSASLPPATGIRHPASLALVLAICLIALAAVRIVATYPETGLTWDEPAYLACGLQYMAQHVYRYVVQHPPLALLMSALGPYLDGVRPLNAQNFYLEGVAEMYRSGHPERELYLMRLGILPFFLLAASVVYLWARRHFGNAVAVVSTGLFTVLPPVLAHGGLATTDMPLTGCLAAAFFALLLWAEEPTWKHSLLLGITTALAVVSRFTALGFLPAAAVFALLAYIVVERPGISGLSAAAKARALPFGLAVITGAVAIWAVYSFSFGKALGWNVSLPAPELFDGVSFALAHNSTGHPGYLLGAVRTTGWWYFFPVVLSVKTPAGFLLLLGIGTGRCWAQRGKLVYWLPLAFSMGILMPAISSKVNIGVRHILPVYAGFSIVAAIAVVDLVRRAQTRHLAGLGAGLAAAALVVWIVVSGAAQHPNYLAYFNEARWLRSPENILVDSDLDWGQDTIRLARRLKELGATQVNFNTLNQTADRLMVWPGFPPVQDINPVKPAEGWTAVSPTMWKVSQYGLEHRYPNLEPWFAYLKPVERVGAYLLYYLPPGSIPPQQR